MPFPARINQIDQGLDRLLDQFKGKPNIEGQLTAYLKQNEDIEKTIFDVASSRSLDTAVGKQLDQIGDIVGQIRDGMSDDDYRVQIKFKISVNNSQGTPEEIMTMLSEATNSTEVRYHEHYPASYMISYDGAFTPNKLLDFIQDASPVGVNIGIMHDQDNTGWVPAEIGDTGAKASRGILPETTAITGQLPVEILIKDTGGKKDLSGFDLSTCFNSQLYTGIGGAIDIDVGFDISDGKCVSFVKCISGETSWEEFISPKLGVNKFRRMGQMTDSIRTLGVTSFSASGFTLDQTGLSGADRFNNSLDQMVVNTFRQKVGFCDIIDYTGDGTILRRLSHTLDKPVAQMLIIPKSSSGTVQHEMYWFKGMTGTQFFSQGVLTENVSIWASQLPNDKNVTIGFDSGTFNPNENGIEYIAVLFAHNPDIGVGGFEYTSTGTLADKITTPYRLGYTNIAGAIQDSRAVFDYKSGAGRGYSRGTSSGGIDTNLFYSIENDGFRLGNSALTNSASGIGKYYYLAIKDPTGVVAPDPKLNTNLKEIFSVDTYQGNATNRTIENGIDLLNDDGLTFHWNTTGSGYVGNYNLIFGATGYKQWLTNSSTQSTMTGSISYLSNGFSLTSGNTWNVNLINYVSMSIKQSNGFMEIVPYTGDGSARQEIAHNLGKGVSLLIISKIGNGNPQTNMWMKGMPNDKVLTYTTTITAGAIWGGSSPTSSIFSVGDIGNNIANMNANGSDYVAYVFADDASVGITCGSYTATGNEGQEVDISSRVGMFMIKNGVSGNGCMNTYKTNIVSKPFSTSPPVGGLLSAIDVNNSKVLLGASNPYTNSVGQTFYWFNIANPNT